MILHIIIFPLEKNAFTWSSYAAIVLSISSISRAFILSIYRSPCRLHSSSRQSSWSRSGLFPLAFFCKINRSFCVSVKSHLKNFMFKVLNWFILNVNCYWNTIIVPFGIGLLKAVRESYKNCNSLHFLYLHLFNSCCKECCANAGIIVEKRKPPSCSKDL